MYHWRELLAVLPVDRSHLSDYGIPDTTRVYLVVLRRSFVRVSTLRLMREIVPYGHYSSNWNIMMEPEDILSILKPAPVPSHLGAPLRELSTRRSFFNAFSRPIPRSQTISCERFRGESGSGGRRSRGDWSWAPSAGCPSPKRKGSHHDGGSPPNPQDLSHPSRHSSADRAARWPPVFMPASESALGFHPWRALSSATDSTSVTAKLALV